MQQPLQQDYESLRAALDSIGANVSKFSDEELKKLWIELYRDEEDIRNAQADSLRQTGLRLSLVDNILAAQERQREHGAAGNLGVQGAGQGAKVAAVEELVQELRVRLCLSTDGISVAASGVSESKFKSIADRMKLRWPVSILRYPQYAPQQPQTRVTKQPQTRLAKQPQSPTVQRLQACVPRYTWSGRDDSVTSVSSALLFMRRNLVPKGVAVVDIHNATWLEARWDDRAVHIKPSKTDFAFVLEEWLQLGNPSATGVPPLQYICGLYESKTTTELQGKLAQNKVQAQLEFMAARQMFRELLYSCGLPRNKYETPVVILGDLNRHFMFKIMSDDEYRVSIIANDGSNEQEARDAVEYIKDVLSKAAASRRQLLRELYPREPKKDGDGAAGSASGQGSPELSPSSPKPRSGPAARASSRGDGTKATAASSPGPKAHGGHISEEEKSVGLDVLDAAAEAAFSADVVALLRMPSTYKSLGLPSAPTSISHSFLSDFWDSSPLNA